MTIIHCRGVLSLLGLASLSLLVACVEPGTRMGTAPKGSGSVTTERLAAQTGAGDSWLTPGGDFGGTHFSPLDQVNTENVDQLGVAWYADIDSPIGLVAEPIVVDGVIYVSAPFSIVHAIDAATGEQLWRFDPNVNPQSIGASMTARFNRGVAVWDGAVYVGTGDCRIVAIDAATGKQLWDSPACVNFDGVGFAGITGAPRVGNGKVFMGHLGSDSAARGSFRAFDAKTGEELWRVYTVPGDPAKGFEQPELEMAAKTWPQGWAPLGGGAVWDAMNYDPVTNLLIVGTASTLPLSVRLRGEGDVLFTNSVLAVDADTGEYRWHYQTVPQDAWDFDATMPKIITDLEIDGKKRRVVMEAGKSGFFYLLDIHTGELLSADAITRVNWASHIDIETGRPVVLESAKWYEPRLEGVLTKVYPSALGARNWEPMAYNPESGLVFLPTSELYTPYCHTQDLLPSCRGMDSLGMRPGDTMPANLGHLSAWDPVKREQRWSIDHTVPFNGGVLTTAGGLVFQGLGTGDLMAYRAEDGTALWSSKTGSNISAAPVTYKLGGDQYVLVAIGTGGGTRIIHNRLATTEDARGPARLVAYKLNANARIPKTTTAAVPIPKPPARVATTPEQLAMAQAAWGSGGCDNCHGGNAMAVNPYRTAPGSIPDLRYSAMLHAGWDAVMMEGVLESKGMPNARTALGMSKEVSDLIRAYVIEQAWIEYELQQQ